MGKSVVRASAVRSRLLGSGRHAISPAKPGFNFTQPTPPSDFVRRSTTDRHRGALTVVLASQHPMLAAFGPSRRGLASSGHRNRTC